MFEMEYSLLWLPTWVPKPGLNLITQDFSEERMQDTLKIHL